MNRHPSAPAAAPPQAPRRGLMARLLGPLHVTGIFWYRIHAVGARCPDWFIRCLMPPFTGLFFVTLISIRRAVAANLEPVLGPCGWWRRQRRIWRTLAAFAWSLTERYQRLLTERNFEVETEGIERFHQIVNAGHGCVLLTGHVGNWEMASSLPVSHAQQRVHVVREREMDAAAQTFIEQSLGRRMGEGYITHFVAEADPRLGLALREALTRGELVALQGDRPRQGGKVLEATLFGRPYPLPAGPLALARQTAAPALPIFVFRTGRRRYRLIIGEPITVPTSRHRHDDLAAAASHFAAQLEDAIRREPHQWFVFREIWP